MIYHNPSLHIAAYCCVPRGIGLHCNISVMASFENNPLFYLIPLLLLLAYPTYDIEHVKRAHNFNEVFAANLYLSQMILYMWMNVPDYDQKSSADKYHFNLWMKYHLPYPHEKTTTTKTPS